MKIYYIEYKDSVKFFNGENTLEIVRRKQRQNNRAIFKSRIP